MGVVFCVCFGNSTLQHILTWYRTLLNAEVVLTLNRYLLSNHEMFCLAFIRNLSKNLIVVEVMTVKAGGVVGACADRGREGRLYSVTLMFASMLLPSRGLKLLANW